MESAIIDVITSPKECPNPNAKSLSWSTYYCFYNLFIISFELTIIAEVALPNVFSLIFGPSYINVYKLNCKVSFASSNISFVPLIPSNSLHIPTNYPPYPGQTTAVFKDL